MAQGNAIHNNILMQNACVYFFSFSINSRIKIDVAKIDVCLFRKKTTLGTTNEIKKQNKKCKENEHSSSSEVKQKEVQSQQKYILTRVCFLLMHSLLFVVHGLIGCWTECVCMPWMRCCWWWWYVCIASDTGRGSPPEPWKFLDPLSDLRLWDLDFYFRIKILLLIKYMIKTHNFLLRTYWIFEIFSFKFRPPQQNLKFTPPFSMYVRKPQMNSPRLLLAVGREAHQFLYFFGLFDAQSQKWWRRSFLFSFSFIRIISIYKLWVPCVLFIEQESRTLTKTEHQILLSTLKFDLMSSTKYAQIDDFLFAYKSIHSKNSNYELEPFISREFEMFWINNKIIITNKEYTWMKHK